MRSNRHRYQLRFLRKQCVRHYSTYSICNETSAYQIEGKGIFVTIYLYQCHR